LNVNIAYATALARKATLEEARKPWDLSKARQGDADGYIHEALDWWMSYEYRMRKELELCPATFADPDDRDAMVRTLEEISEGLRQLAQKLRRGRVT
jgi:hypothetical protein